MSTFPYDLHVHTKFSDGDWLPEIILQKAKQQGIKGIAITDHNVINSYPATLKAAHKYGIKIYPGIEISTLYKGIEIHILGYATKENFFNEKILLPGLKNTLKGYNQKSKKSLGKCLKLKIINKFDWLRIKNSRPTGSCVTKYNIAQFMAPYLKKPARIAQKYFNRTGSCFTPYNPKLFMSPGQAVDLINKSKGIAVLAHPGEVIQKLKTTNIKAQNFINKLLLILVSHHLAGLELSHPQNKPEQSKFFSTLVNKYHLIATGGSDWHGERHHPEITLGENGLTEREFKRFEKFLREKLLG